ncbi:unnamed protein product [Effrenium voratum]|nr:unnamed protein product [Effrenium voratum]
MWLRRDGGVGMEPAVGLPLGVNEYAPLGISTVSSSTSPLARAAAGARRLHFQSSEICCQVRGARRQCSGRVTEATALEVILGVSLRSLLLAHRPFFGSRGAGGFLRGGTGLLFQRKNRWASNHPWIISGGFKNSLSRLSCMLSFA